jgi:UDP-4-amino-4,6-dideoxy-N-acetyl-beta-L-altrosamine transaminase
MGLFQQAGEELAVYGGAQVRETWLPYGHQRIDEEDIAAVVSVLRSDWISQGPKIEEFERAVADYCGVRYAVAFSSGTAALHAACAAAKLGQGDEVVTTPLTFVATANAIVFCGAKPVFADIRLDTLNIDPAQVERRITPQTKAVIAVDFAGQPADLEEILFLAKRRHLTVIEDACHALGAEYRGRKIGSISAMTVLSFHPVKPITSGEGGMVLTHDADIARRMRSFRHHGIVCPDPSRPWRNEMEEIGYNYRITDMQCALGLSQLRRLNDGMARRQEIAARYEQAFSAMDEISLPSTAPDVLHARHIFVLLLNLDRLAADQDEILAALRAENIGATLHYPLVHLRSFYRRQFGYGEGLCPTAEAVARRMVTLPLFSAMTDGDVEDVIRAVEKVILCFRRK